MRFAVSLVPASTDWGWIPGYNNDVLFTEDSTLLFGDFDDLVPQLRPEDSVTLNITADDDWIWLFETSFFGFGITNTTDGDDNATEYYTKLDTTYN